jgi:hypothetical protein
VIVWLGVIKHENITNINELEFCGVIGLALGFLPVKKISSLLMKNQL